MNKKENINKIIKDKSKVVMETLELILTDSIPVLGKLEFASIKRGKEEICTLEIYVPKRGYERHWLMEVSSLSSHMFYEQILLDLLENFGNLEKVKMSNFYKETENNFYGLKLENSLGSVITLNFVWQGDRFEEIVDLYHKKRKNCC